MSSHVDVLGSAATVVVLVMVVAWLISLATADAGVADVAWALGLVAIAWISWWVGDGLADRRSLLVAMVTIWGLRLAVHLVARSRGRPEDPRYAEMRQRSAGRFPVTSLFTVFLAKGLAMFVISLPVQLAMTPTGPEVGVAAIIGVVIWGVGLFFETVADAQLTRFRNAPDADEPVLDWGLWRYSRHPNYFGEICIWWGLALVAAETTDARWTLFGPALLTLLIVRVTGIPVLERHLHSRHEGYENYTAQTSPLLPRPSKAPTP